MSNTNPKTRAEVVTYLNDDIDGWASIKSGAGEILPADKDVLTNLFYKAKMECSALPVTVRMGAREELLNKGALAQDEYPITILEKVKKIKLKQIVYTHDAKATLKKYPDVTDFVFIFDLERERNAGLMKFSQALQGNIDQVRTNVRNYELYTLSGVCFHFVTQLSDKTIEGDKIVFAYVTNVA